MLDRNDRAIRFYERFGWFPDGAVMDDDSGAVVLHEVRYRKTFA